VVAEQRKTGKITYFNSLLGANAVFIASDKTRIYPVVYYDWCCAPWIYDQATRNIVAVAITLK
jgi:hypothetical protein